MLTKATSEDFSLVRGAEKSFFAIIWELNV